MTTEEAFQAEAWGSLCPALAQGPSYLPSFESGYHIAHCVCFFLSFFFTFRSSVPSHVQHREEFSLPQLSC